MEANLRGVGIDIVDVARIARLVDGRESFARRWFSEDEVAWGRSADSRAEGIAQLLAAKEAAWKAIAIPWNGGVPWAELWIVDGSRGRRGVRCTGDVASAVEAAGVGSIEVGSVCDGRIALAVALAWATESGSVVAEVSK